MLPRLEKFFESLLWNSRLIVLGAVVASLVVRLAKLVLLILVVKFFEHALTLKYGGPLELLQLAAGILLVSLALFLTQGKLKA